MWMDNRITPGNLSGQLLLTTASRGSGNSGNTKHQSHHPTIDNLWQIGKLCTWQAAISATGSSTDVVALVDDARTGQEFVPRLSHCCYCRPHLVSTKQIQLTSPRIKYIRYIRSSILALTNCLIGASNN